MIRIKTTAVFIGSNLPVNFFGCISSVPNRSDYRRNFLKQNLHSNRTKLLILLGISLALFILLGLITNTLKPSAQDNLILVLFLVGVFWILVAFVSISVLLLIHIQRQTINLKRLDLDQAVETIKSESKLQWEGAIIMFGRITCFSLMGNPL